MKYEEMKQKLNAGEDLMVIDIREDDELIDVPMVSEAIHLPMGEVFTSAAEGNLPKDKTIVTICRSGGRCRIVADELNEKGYHVEIMEGGMNALTQ